MINYISRKLVLIALPLNMFIVLLALPASAETISIVADYWCPYNCNPQSKQPGFMVEIAKKAFARYKINVEYTVMPWTNAITETRAGKYTAIVGASYMDAPDFIFPNTPQGWMQNVFYIKKDDMWRFENIDSLKDVALGIITDYSYNPLLNDYIESNKNNKNRIQAESGDDALETNINKLLIGKIRSVVEAEYVMKYYLSKHTSQEPLEEAGRLRATEQDNLYIAFGPNEPNAQKYIKILSLETNAMRASGELAKILQTYGLKDWEK